MTPPDDIHTKPVSKLGFGITGMSIKALKSLQGRPENPCSSGLASKNREGMWMLRKLNGFNRRRRVYYLDLIQELIIRNIKLTYKNSALGILWSLINPLLQLLIFYFLFQKVFSLNISRYSLFAFSGILAWTWFQASLNQAVNVIRASRELVKQPGFPTMVLPATAVGTNLIKFLIAIVMLMLFQLLSGTLPGVSLLALPAVMAIQFVFMLSLAYLVAALNILFFDTQHILSVALQLYFFVTPIFYDINSVPERYRGFYLMNPMAHLVDAYRNILMNGMFRPSISLIIIFMFSLAFLWVSMRFFKRMSHRFAEEL
jgi:lipopolysaccharide transport system permease protein